MTIEPSAKLSVIIPARNAETVLPRCLQAIKTSSQPPHEVIVVDDYSTDLTARIARVNGVKLLNTGIHSGPAAARNLGAHEASGDVLCFIDADVVVQPETLSRIASHFQTNSSLAAVFGSYDDDPAEPNFLSQYKNLQHHYVHQKAKVEASTFWAGCGAIRPRVFHELGGFDAERYPAASIEDIELGYRIAARGYRVALDKTLCVKHLKKWTFQSHVRTEIFQRALPWSRLIVEGGPSLRDLNLTKAHRSSAVLTWLFVASCVQLLFHRLFIVPVFVIFVLLFVLNRGFYRFLLKQRGAAFLMKALPFHFLHYWYSSGVFGFCWLLSSDGGFRSKFNRLRRTNLGSGG